VLLCVVFGVIVFAFAEPLADAFGNAELAAIMRAMAVLPLIHALSIAPVAAAQRDMLFQSITLRTIISLVAGGVFGLVLALMGFGVWALVWQALVQRSVAVVVLWLAVPLPFELGISRRHLREIGGFALPVMLSRVMGWGSGQLPRLILGLYLGPADLGLFTIAARLNAIVNAVAIGPKAVVARVDLRRFATDNRALADAVRRVFLQISMLSYPICFGGAAITPTLFQAWLDQRWYPAVVPSELMLLSSAPYVTFYGTTAVLYALNKQRAEAAVATALSLGVVVAVAVSASSGLVATTAMMAIVTLAAVPLAIVVVQRSCKLGLRDLIAPQAPAFVASCLMGGAVALLRAQLAPAHSSLTVLAVCIMAGVVLYTLLIAALMPSYAMQTFQYLHRRAVAR
jgi:PST family polysaccharide transporter